MKITFLGTGTSYGIPHIACSCAVCTSLDFRNKRLRTSVHIEADGQSIVIDTGPDFRQQANTHNIQQLDAVLFTHEHKDHTAGLHELRAWPQHPIPIYARSEVMERLQREHAALFESPSEPSPVVLPHLIDEQPFQVDSLLFIPIEVLHYQTSVLGFRLGDFTYITDAKEISEASKQKMKGTRILVLNALQHEQNVAHLTLSEAIGLAKELQPEMTYLVHISHSLGLHEEVSRTLPEGVELACDGLRVDLY